MPNEMQAWAKCHHQVCSLSLCASLRALHHNTEHEQGGSVDLAHRVGGGVGVIIVVIVAAVSGVAGLRPAGVGASRVPS